MSESGNPFLDFNDDDLKVALQRAFKTTAVLGVALAVVLAVVFGWQTGALLLSGALISAVGLWEWQRLVVFINAKLDKQQAPGGAGRVVVMFSLRLLLAAGILYGSLKCFHGSVYALVAGLGLAVLALTIEAIRLIRS